MGTRALPLTLLRAPTELLVPGAWLMTVAGGTTTSVESPQGTLTIVGDGTNQGRADQSFATIPGRSYRLSFTVATNAFALSVGTSQGGNQIVNAVAAAVGPNVQTFTATTARTWIRLFKMGATTSVASGLRCRII